jgi:hypothetical protein
LILASGGDNLCHLLLKTSITYMARLLYLRTMIGVADHD